MHGDDLGNCQHHNATQLSQRQTRHFGLFGAASTAVMAARAEVGAGNFCLRDAEDAVGDAMIADLPKGRAVLGLTAALHYDV